MVLHLTLCFQLVQAISSVSQQTCSLPDVAACESASTGGHQFIQFKRTRTLYEQPLLAEDDGAALEGVADMDSSIHDISTGSGDSETSNRGLSGTGFISDIQDGTDSRVYLPWAGLREELDETGSLAAVDEIQMGSQSHAGDIDLESVSNQQDDILHGSLSHARDIDLESVSNQQDEAQMGTQSHAGDMDPESMSNQQDRSQIGSWSHARDMDLESASNQQDEIQMGTQSHAVDVDLESMSNQQDEIQIGSQFHARDIDLESESNQQDEILLGSRSHARDIDFESVSNQQDEAQMGTQSHAGDIDFESMSNQQMVGLLASNYEVMNAIKQLPTQVPTGLPGVSLPTALPGVPTNLPGVSLPTALPGVPTVPYLDDEAKAEDECSFISAPPCEQMATHNCTNVGSLPQFCPEACSYVVADPLYHCEAACVSPTKCYEGGTATTFDNPANKVCEEGPIEGCRLYGPHTKGQVQQTCQECSGGFELQEGKCVFLPVYRQGAIVAGIIVAVILAIVLPFNIYRWCLPVGNATAVDHGWSHQNECLVSEDNYNDPTLPVKLYPLSTNMRKTLVAGPGLNLFYRSLLFILIIALILAASLSLLYSLSDLGVGGEQACDPSQLESTAKSMQNSQKMYAYSFGALWLVVLFLSLLYARNQHLGHRELDAETHLMADFATKAEGFPPDADEAEIKSYFDQIAPGSVLAVSLAYDYREHASMVKNLLAKQLVDEEVAQGFVPWEHDMENPIDQDKEAIKQMLKSFKGSGVAFPVSATEVEKQKMVDAFEATKPLFRGRWLIEFSHIKEEPTTFYWVNFPYRTNTHIVHSLLEIGIVLIEAAILAALLFLPAAYFMYNYSKANGIGKTSLESTCITMCVGLLITVLNLILYFLVDLSCHRIGLYYKVDIDRCNLIGCTLIVGITTIFNLVLVLEAVKAADNAIDQNLFEGQSAQHRRLREESINMSVAQKIFELLVPSVLILPDIVGRFFKYVCGAKALYNYLVAIPFFKWDMRSNKDLTFMEAEEGLLPTPMQTEFDYANSICIFGTVFFMFGLPGYYPVVTCWILVAWVFMTYGSLKFCHLRYAMFTEYTSCFLDDCATYLWGIPVSLIAANSVHWAQEAWTWDIPYLDFFVAAAAFVLYCVLLTIVFECVDPYDEEGTSDYASASERLRYDYFNTNPVHVLKTLYLDDYGPALVYFRRGKEHLQSKFVKKSPVPEKKQAKRFELFEMDNTSCFPEFTC